MLINILETAFNLIVTLNSDLFEIINLSLKVTLSALIISVIFSIPFGAFLVFYKNTRVETEGQRLARHIALKVT